MLFKQANKKKENKIKLNIKKLVKLVELIKIFYYLQSLLIFKLGKNIIR